MGQQKASEGDESQPPPPPSYRSGGLSLPKSLHAFHPMDAFGFSYVFAKKHDARRSLRPPGRAELMMLLLFFTAVFSSRGFAS